MGLEDEVERHRQRIRQQHEDATRREQEEAEAKATETALKREQALQDRNAAQALVDDALRILDEHGVVPCKILTTYEQGGLLGWRQAMKHVGLGWPLELRFGEPYVGYPRRLALTTRGRIVLISEPSLAPRKDPSVLWAHRRLGTSPGERVLILDSGEKSRGQQSPLFGHDSDGAVTVWTGDWVNSDHEGLVTSGPVYCRLDGLLAASIAKLLE